MRFKSDVLVLAVFFGGVFLWHGSSLHAQSNWVFERQDSGGATVSTEVFAQTSAGIDADPFSFTFNEVFAEKGVTVGSESSSHTAAATIAGSASVLTVVGAQTFVPTIDSALAVEALAAGTGDGAEAGTFSSAANSAFASGTFDIVSTGTAVNAWLHGSFYLVAIPLYLGNAPGLPDTCHLDCTFVRAEIGPWHAQASYDEFEMNWDVEADLPSGTFIEMDLSGANHFFDFVVPITAGVDDFSFLAGSVFTGSAKTDNLNSLSSMNLGLSASAWAVLTPIGESPLTGDFDGDGDVDDDDLITGWQVSFGANTSTGMAVTLSRGDADHDGDVDGADFLAWQRGFGSSYSTTFGVIASAAQVPEPSTVALLSLCGIVLLIPIPSRLKSYRSRHLE